MYFWDKDIINLLNNDPERPTASHHESDIYHDLSYYEGFQREKDGKYFDTIIAQKGKVKYKVFELSYIVIENRFEHGDWGSVLVVDSIVGGIAINGCEVYTFPQSLRQRLSIVLNNHFAQCPNVKDLPKALEKQFYHLALNWADNLDNEKSKLGVDSLNDLLREAAAEYWGIGKLMNYITDEIAGVEHTDIDLPKPIDEQPNNEVKL